MKKHTSEAGFSILVGLTVLVVVAVIGFGGWYVWVGNKKTSDGTKQIAGNVSDSNKGPKHTDPTQGWTSYSSAKGNFSLKHPVTWVAATNLEQCPDGLLMMGANKESVGKCGTNDFGQITVTWRQDRTFCGDLNPEVWTQNSKETVMVSGVNGTKITATVKQTGAGLSTLPIGTQTTQYCFVARDTTYVANYTQLSTYPDALSDFNLMIAKTLKIE